MHTHTHLAKCWQGLRQKQSQGTRRYKESMAVLWRHAGKATFEPEKTTFCGDRHAQRHSSLKWTRINWTWWSTCEAETGDLLQMHGQPCLQNKYQVRQGYEEGSCVKNKMKTTKPPPRHRGFCWNGTLLQHCSIQLPRFQIQAGAWRVSHQMQKFLHICLDPSVPGNLNLCMQPTLFLSIWSWESPFCSDVLFPSLLTRADPHCPLQQHRVNLCPVSIRSSRVK